MSKRVSVWVCLWWIAAALTSCATSTPANVVPGSNTSDVQEVSPQKAATRHTRPDDVISADIDVPIQLAKPLLIVTNPTATGITLFPEELIPLRAALAAALAKSYDVVSLQTVANDVKNARTNVLPNGKQCDRTPHPILISHAIHEGSSLTDSQVMCGENGCELRIQSRDNRVRLHTKLTSPRAEDSPQAIVAQWVEDLERRPLEQTRRGELPIPSPIVATVKRSKNARVIGSVDPSSAVSKDLGKPLQSVLKAMEKCASVNPTMNPKDRYLLSLDTRGKVDRCESEHLDHHASEGFDCICTALKKNVRFPKAKKDDAERRVAMSLSVDSGNESLPSVFLAFQSSDDKVAHLATETTHHNALARCMAPLGSDFEVGVIMEVAGQGEHIAHSTSWTTVGKRAVPDSVKACLKPILRAVKMTCPWNERAKVRGKVLVAFNPLVE